MYSCMKNIIRLLNNSICIFIDKKESTILHRKRRSNEYIENIMFRSLCIYGKYIYVLYQLCFKSSTHIWGYTTCVYATLTSILHNDRFSMPYSNIAKKYARNKIDYAWSSFMFYGRDQLPQFSHARGIFIRIKRIIQENEKRFQ